MELLKAFQISASGMSVERTRIEIVSANIANAHSTRSADGVGPYQRRQPVVEASAFDKVYEGNFSSIGGQDVSVPQVMDVVTDETPGPRVYDPGHPDADEQGFVAMPNVSVVSEMVELMNASRAYEANMNAIDATKDMAMKALEIGRG